MITYITGKYSRARIMTMCDGGIYDQVTRMVNSPGINNPVVIMPDCHVGVGSVIGFTMPYTDKVIPNVVGVDIGCGMLTHRIDYVPSGQKYEEIDSKIRSVIPTGQSVHDQCLYALNQPKYTDLFKRVGIDCNYAERSLGTLGGGNHFIELGIHSGNTYVTIHSGSRNLGLKVCKYHQGVAQRPTDTTQQISDLKEQHEHGDISGIELGQRITELKKSSRHSLGELSYLEGDALQLYLHDMQLCQEYAHFNRLLMMQSISKVLGVLTEHVAESVHNYIDTRDHIIRKGAIRSYLNEPLIIPINRTFGTIIGTGMSNPDWNFSAPHGAGRIMSRSEAKKLIPQDLATQRMQESNVYSSFNPVDEDDAAYKDPADIIDAVVGKTVSIDFVIKPILNIK